MGGTLSSRTCHVCTSTCALRLRSHPYPRSPTFTGISVFTTDTDGSDHSFVISVADPHNLESSCQVGTPSCLADGALHVVIDGEEALLSPEEVSVAPGVAIAAVNLPGACRSFGFERYWERKKLECLGQEGRKLSSAIAMKDMSDWILSDPTATDTVECAEYVASAKAVGGGAGLFAKRGEHASFKKMTPAAKPSLSHGRLHQLPMRDPTDQFDLRDHLAWQTNMAVDHSEMSLDATGILGETLVPTVDDKGDPIMQGMDAIRGQHEDCEYAERAMEFRMHHFEIRTAAAGFGGVHQCVWYVVSAHTRLFLL